MGGKLVYSAITNGAQGKTDKRIPKSGRSQIELAKMLMSPSAVVRIATVRKLNGNTNALKFAAINSPNTDAALVAVEQLDEAEALMEIVKGSKIIEVRLAAAGKIYDPNVLRELAKDIELDNKLRSAALSRIDDVESLKELTREDDRIGLAAVRKLKGNADALEEIICESDSEKMILTAIRQIGRNVPSLKRLIKHANLVLGLSLYDYDYYYDYIESHRLARTCKAAVLEKLGKIAVRGRDEEALEILATHSEDHITASTAVRRISNKEALERVAMTCKAYVSAEAAINRLRNEMDALIRIAAGAGTLEARMKAYEKLECDRGAFEESVKRTRRHRLNDSLLEMLASKVSWIEDQEVLRLLAENTRLKTAGLEAVEKLDDRGALIEVAKSADLAGVRQAALKKLGNDVSALKKVICETCCGDIISSAIDKIGDSLDTLKGLLGNTLFGVVGQDIIIGKLASRLDELDEKTLQTMAIKTEDDTIRAAAIERITDVDLLLGIRSETEDEEVRATVDAKLGSSNEFVVGLADILIRTEA